ncbi:MAG: alpha/beta fold hydrolase [Rhodobacteraceae bacterium]|nr:alpha/beta fold hydrolase [Paracoccaceae bacterium]
MTPPAHWPNRDKGRHIRTRPHDWWVVEDGTGPTILLLHGAGGSGHSFAPLLPYLTPHYRCIIPDLPGQGFTRAGARGRFGLDPTADDLATFCDLNGIAPAAIIGHSAGAAIALRLSEILSLQGVVGINAALGTFEGLAGTLFPMLARGFASIPFLPSVIARTWGNAARVNGLLDGTGSQLSPEARAQYLTLVQSAAHIDGALGMMSQWNLTPLVSRLGSNPVPTLLITGDKDRTVPPRISRDAAARMPAAQYAELPGLGHLAQEEAPKDIADLILPWLRSHMTQA